MMVSASVCARRSRGRCGALVDLGPQLDGHARQVGRHLRGVDAQLQHVVVGRVLEAVVDGVVDPTLEALEAVVELRRLHGQRDQHPLHPHRGHDGAAGPDRRTTAAKPPAHWRQGSGAVWRVGGPALAWLLRRGVEQSGSSSGS